jgi:hypothetical protein
MAMVVIEALNEARRNFSLPHMLRVDQGCQFTTRSVMLRQSHHAGLLQAGKANGQRLCRELQRPRTAGMLGTALAHGSGRRRPKG